MKNIDTDTYSEVDSEKEIQNSVDEYINSIPEKEIKKVKSPGQMSEIGKSPELKMPEIGKRIVVKIIGTPIMKKKGKDTLPICPVMLLNNEIEAKEQGMYILKITKSVWTGILVEFKRQKLDLDEDLHCLVGKILIIEGKEYDKFKGVDKSGKEWKGKIFSTQILSNSNIAM